MRQIKARPAPLRQNANMMTFFYRCPSTDLRIAGQHQAWPLPAGPLDTYVAQSCPACGGLHIVNPATGRLLSQERRDTRLAGRHPQPAAQVLA